MAAVAVDKKFLFVGTSPFVLLSVADLNVDVLFDRNRTQMITRATVVDGGRAHGGPAAVEGRRASQGVFEPLPGHREHAIRLQFPAAWPGSGLRSPLIAPVASPGRSPRVETVHARETRLT
jgi:hypothetical protein